MLRETLIVTPDRVVDTKQQSITGSLSGGAGSGRFSSLHGGCPTCRHYLSQYLPTVCKYWGGPLWRDRFLLWFLDPKLVPTKITFFPFREGARSWENQ